MEMIAISTIIWEAAAKVSGRKRLTELALLCRSCFLQSVCLGEILEELGVAHIRAG